MSKSEPVTVTAGNAYSVKKESVHTNESGNNDSEYINLYRLASESLMKNDYYKATQLFQKLL
jgi:hypothetical protein